MSAPPGFHTVPTTADGNCLFHSIFYAWFPEEGVDVANRSESAVLIRKIIADSIGIDVGLTTIDLEGLHGNANRKAEILADMNRLDMEYINLRAPADDIRMGEIDQRKLDIYKELILMSPNFWGGYKEIAAANKYAMENSLPLIYVWDQVSRNWWDRGEQSMRIPKGEPCRDWAPIANDSNIHFSICVRDEASPSVPSMEEVKVNNFSEVNSAPENTSSSADDEFLYPREGTAAILQAQKKNKPKITELTEVTEVTEGVPSLLSFIIDSIKSGTTLPELENIGYNFDTLVELGVPNEYINQLYEQSPAGGSKQKKRKTKKRKISKKKQTRKY